MMSTGRIHLYDLTAARFCLRMTTQRFPHKPLLVDDPRPKAQILSPKLRNLNVALKETADSENTDIKRKSALNKAHEDQGL